ncbi:MarR family transcriptional regulator [Xanthomonas citri pv. anacardii]|uniref:AsnC family protein n=1 Tax=Xanthomonas citri TaxID=346 RepID=UPI0015E177CA|nr:MULTISPECIES: AsnC family protein [Xanthomonas]MEE5090012.1 AsnC family protein [Xanthomonas euvesicatoria]MCT8357945.1 MarR family transcriptional regulator [Xanthomonas citri pv. anacardii]MCT8362000.1 MarR family transcriptional regulator [Xanthomonas citri pv. anacardii]MCT8366021.1 MarR family transcriptional regulator [Xanthomonas citri pv. anacardii]MCT8370628.1 MarR family transcriptional regulator [Xanthomonas citri pv. anacardii]
MEYGGLAVELKPQDLVVLYKQVAQAGQAWTYASLGEALGMSPSQVHRSVKRAVASGLALEKGRGEWETVRTALHEFAVHGVRYAFPAVIGPPKRGIPTAFGVPPLSTTIASAPGEAPVWPSAQGTAKGPGLSPLSAGAPNAALADPTLHQLLALQDALRSGRARERTLAARYLKQLLGLSDAV